MGPRTLEEGARLFAGQQQISQTQIYIGDFATDRKSVAPYGLSVPESDFQQYIISLGANNGNWIEEILMKREPGPYPGSHSGNQHWSQATSVTGTGIKKPFTVIDPDYPKAPNGDPIHFSVNLKPASH